jgi:urease subunit beta
VTIPGEILAAAEPVQLFADRDIVNVAVVNTGDRPVQVGSHYHFFEANPALQFDRGAAYGRRLAVAAGTSVRFEPGIDLTVDLVPIGGRRVVAGLRGAVQGPLDR